MYVIVTLPIGEASFSRCEIDQFGVNGELEVVRMQDGETVRTFQEGEWLHATVFDHHDYPLYWFSAPKSGQTLQDTKVVELDFYAGEDGDL